MAIALRCGIQRSDTLPEMGYGQTMQFDVPAEIASVLRLGSEKNVQTLLQSVLDYFNKVQRPSYIGPISLTSGITLRQLTLLVDILVHNGRLRKASPEQVYRTFGVESGDPAVYVLV